MNTNHLQQIFSNYIKRFEELNGPAHGEYYKWQIAKQFRPMMDTALSSNTSEFPEHLKRIKKMTENFIDSYTQPFGGLVKFAEKDPETVKSMFRDLLADDGGDLQKRSQKIKAFLNQSHELRKANSDDGYLFKNDMHSVTGFLFLYDPDHNYIYKATHAQAFADCIEFYDDWGSGESVDITTYYRMCDHLVEEIKNSDALLATDASRFENGWGVDPDTLYPDNEKHVLAFDIIYCASTYGLYEGITFVRPKSKERQLMQERKEKALQLTQRLEKARKDADLLEEAKDYLNRVFAVGESIHHTSYGDGAVTANTGKLITVNFADAGEKNLGTALSAANGIISSATDDYKENIEKYMDVLKKDSSIETIIKAAERDFEPYAEYLE